MQWIAVRSYYRNLLAVAIAIYFVFAYTNFRTNYSHRKTILKIILLLSTFERSAPQSNVRLRRSRRRLERVGRCPTRSDPRAPGSKAVGMSGVQAGVQGERSTISGRWGVRGWGWSDEERLLNQLFADYNQFARPLIRSTSTVTVTLQFSLLNLKDLVSL